MPKDFIAHIKNPERAAEWQAVFGSEQVYVTSPFPEMGDLPGLGRVQIYKLDLALLTPDQRRRLVEHIAGKFGLDPELVDRDLNQVGCPVLARDVTLVVHHAQRWLG
jgi:hypothetical protein